MKPCAWVMMSQVNMLVLNRQGLSLIHIFPYYIGDVITDPEELTLQTPESFFKRFRINMKIHHEVISIHPERKTRCV